MSPAIAPVIKYMSISIWKDYLAQRRKGAKKI